MAVGDDAPHAHLWVLADGTPAHAAPGRLTRNDDGDLACHLCGRWFTHLGAHLRRHGWTAQQYRDAVGLAQNRALCNERLSGRIARRQTAHWNQDPDLQAQFAAGRDAGRAALAAAGTRRVAPETARAAAEQLQRVRARQAARRDHALRALAALADARSVGDLLRGCYEAGDDLDDLQRLTGWARARLRRELVAAGTRLRAPGSNTAAGRANRARRVDAQVAARVGTDDVVSWLRGQRMHGATIDDLSVRTGRSTAWVRARLRGTTTTARHRTG